MIMYKRDEKIEEEQLDWDEESTPKTDEKELTVIKPYEPRPKNYSSKDEGKYYYELPKQSSLESFLEKYEILTLVSGGLLLPYIVGLLFNSALFYMYSGVTIAKIFSVNKNPTIFELWTIGAYFFVTLWLIGIVMKILFGKR